MLTWFCFSDEFGELLPGDSFTVEEMRTYLFKHPLHFKDGDFKPKEGLTLWLQRNPSDSKARYGLPSASRCRFRGCIAAYSLIGQGHNRICFGEFLSSVFSTRVKLIREPL